MRIDRWIGAVLIAALGGCAHAPPEREFDDALAAAGVAPIQFIAAAMPTDAYAGAAGLTIEEAVRQTLRTSPSVQIALAEVRSALAEARQARLIPNPVINVALRWPEEGGKPVIEAGLAADLVSLLLQPRRVSAADNRLRAASSEALTAVLDQLLEVQERYAAVAALDAQANILERRKALLRRLLDLAGARVQAGEASRLDVITLDAERVALDVEITQAASKRTEGRLVLARLIGQPSGPTDWKLPPWTPIAPVASGEMQCVAAALKHRPEIQARRWSLAALGDEAELARFDAFNGAEIGIDAEREGDWTLGPAVSTPVPLLDWGQQKRARADAQRISERHRLTQARRQVIEEVRRAWHALTASQAALRQVETELIPLSDDRVKQTEASYQNGLADVTAVLLAEQESQAARGKLIELQQESASAQYRLERAVGGPAIAGSIPKPTEQP